MLLHSRGYVHGIAPYIVSEFFYAYYAGTGICQAGGTNGASVVFTYSESANPASGGTITTLTMTFNFDEGRINGFMGSPQGGNYAFMGGYHFDHPGDKGLGVPSSYSIPANYVATYTARNAIGKTTITVTQFVPHVREPEQR